MLFQFTPVFAYILGTHLDKDIAVETDGFNKRG
jgi:hypothetical protein